MSSLNDDFYRLGPETILQAVESLGYQSTGRFSALNSYENRVYEIEIEDHESLVAKFYRPGRWSSECILEEHKVLQILVNAEIPVVAPMEINEEGQTLGQIDSLYFAVFPKVKGRVKQELTFEEMTWIGRLIGRIHATLENVIFNHRPVLSVQSFGQDSLEILLNSSVIDSNVRERYKQYVPSCLEKLAMSFANVGQDDWQAIHGDLHASNLLWTEEGPVIFDFDDFVSGPRVQDLWLLIPGPVNDNEEFMRVIRENYQLFADYPAHQVSLIEPLRKLRMIKHAAWIAKRWDDPVFPRTFEYFSDSAYHQQLIADLLEEY